MYRSIKKMINIFKGNHGIPVKFVCTGIFSAFAYSAWNHQHSLHSLNGILERCNEWRFQSEAQCQGIEQTEKSSNKNREEENQENKDKSTDNTPPENEFRIILLGATGSGKSSAGNDLLKQKEAFKTSCYAQSETKESEFRTSEWNKDSITYKIDIIDTPVAFNTELPDEKFEREIRKAIAFSAPGPHAFLLCIPATSTTESHKTALKHYEKYFKDIGDFTIVAFTRYDELLADSFNEGQEKFKSTSNLNFKHKIILRNNDHNDKTEELINIILKSKESRTKRKEKDYASCDLSEHAEKKLKECMVKISTHRTVYGQDISRDTVKMIPDYRKHFAFRCRFKNK